MPPGLDPRDMLARLVAFPTISSRSNLDLVAFAEDWLAGFGIASWRVPDPTGEKAGLFALIGRPVAGGVVLHGHTDVVPVAGQDWTSDPFTLTERDGCLFGRGTCDMKGWDAILLALVPEMVAADLRRPIILALTCDEEIGCIGAPPLIEAMLATLPRPEAVIVGEPSEMRVVTGHKASWGFRGHVRGHEVHSSLVHAGVSAVMLASRLIAWMDATMAENAAAARPSGYVPPYTTLHVGLIEGGTASNIVARDCRFSGEMRVMPDEPLDVWQARFHAEIDRLLTEVRAIRPEAAITIETRMLLPGFAPPPGNPAETLARRLTGDNASTVVSYQTEAGHFQARDLATVICGPGSIDQAHQADEFISIAQLDAGTEFVRRLIRTLAA